jgi:hypothetical protein
MNQQETEYAHIVSCIGNLNEAWLILHNIKKNNGNPLVNPSFQFALIEYSKPYKKSYDENKQVYKLENNPPKHVPPQYLDLHKRITDSRDRIFAHSDLAVDDAKVYVTNTFYGKHVGISKNVVYDTEMIGEIDTIIELIEQSLDSMYKKAKQLEAALPVNS